MSINRQKLLGILGTPKDISDKDLEELENAVQQYPYFQLGYSLIAKAKYDRQTPDAYDSLSIAAIYAPDRSTLKKIFYDNLCIDVQVTNPTDEVQTVADAPAEIIPEVTEPSQIEEENKTVVEETEEEVLTENDAASEEEQSTFTASEPPHTEEEETNIPKLGGEIEITEADSEEPEVSVKKKEEDEAVYRELEENLKNLRENKLKFEDEEEDTESSDKKKTINETVLPENEGESIEIPSSDDQKSALTENYKGSREKGTSRLITEISSLTPLPADHLRTKQQTQFSLIDKFINAEPEIVYKDQGSPDVQVSDFSEKSTLTRSYLLTENFAAIMLKQGKVDKAIEIYRKLIWKFPQKKAYFAGRIKELKESE